MERCESSIASNGNSVVASAANASATVGCGTRVADDHAERLKVEK